MENITVCVRIRPPSKNRDEESMWKIDGNVIQSIKSKEIFTYDRIIEPEESNENIFSTIVKEPIESFLRGVNLSIFAYGQTSTGKTYTMRGSNNNLNGMIPLSIKEITNRLTEEESQNSGNFKYILKASYLELYNETVNDLLDGNKKNLEIRESLQKGVFVNGLTEIPISTYDKAMQLLKQGENLRVIAETKLNEKSSRSHVVFRLNLEVTRQVEGKQKTFISQLNLIDLAGSENVSKAKTDGIRMKEGSNINKSLLALSNVIQKLSSNPKSFVNYRDSKLTRLLQPALSGNSRTMIFCTISEAMPCYSETINTLHFGAKAKTIKTIIKVNEMLDEKSKILLENTQLKSKIKQLEDMITEKKTSTDETSISTGAPTITTVNVSKTTNSATDKCQSDLISTLEKEVSLLKKILITNEEIGDADVNSLSNEILSTNSNNVSQIYNNLYCANSGNNMSSLNNNHLLLSATKHNLHRQQQTSNSMLMSSGKKMTDSARKIYRREENFSVYSNTHNFNEHEYNVPVTSNSVFRRCMTDMKMNSFAPSIYSSNNNSTNTNVNNYLLNTQQKNKYMPSTTNYLTASAYKTSNNPNINNSFMGVTNTSFDTDFDFLCPSNDNSMQLLKENDELRKNLYELRKNFLETVQNKENQIKSLNYYLTTTNESCEKLIKEAEENYINLKLNFDRTQEDVLNKDTEIKNLNQTIRNYEANANYYKEEINRLNNEINRLNETFKQDNIYRDLEVKLIENTKNFENLSKIYENDKNLLNELKIQNEKYKNEIGSVKMQLENYKSENLSFKTQYDVMKKNSDLLLIENNKLKNDIESYKNEIASSKDKIIKMKNELNQLNKSKEALTIAGGNEKSGKKDKKITTNPMSNANSSTKCNPKLEELENKINTQNNYISQLESQVTDYKNNLVKIEESQILEYQKLLEESFAKMAELQSELEAALQKNIYLEKVVKLSCDAGNLNKTDFTTEKKLLASVKNQTPLKERKKCSTNIREINPSLNDPANISQFSFKENEPPSLHLKDDEKLENYSIMSPAQGHDFIGKKRKHLTKMFQNILDKNLINGGVRDESVKNSIEGLNKFKFGNHEDKENIKDGHDL